MYKAGFNVNITTGISILLLLIGGAGIDTIFFNSIYAQTATLGEPIFVEKGGDTIKRVLDPNTTQYVFTSNGILNGNIDYNEKGEYISIAKGNNETFDQGKRCNND